MIRAITENEFDTRTRGNPYWANRWQYIDVALLMAFYYRGFFVYLPKTGLEIGPRDCPVLLGADTMDIDPRQDVTWKLDAGATPWPFKDAYYDLIVALQVWEHLEGRQRDAFRELKRCCSGVAVLSFPLMWDVPNNPSHHRISRDEIRDWTLGIEPYNEVIVGGEKNYQRLVAIWDFGCRRWKGKQ